MFCGSISLAVCIYLYFLHIYGTINLIHLIDLLIQFNNFEKYHKIFFSTYIYSITHFYFGLFWLNLIYEKIKHFRKNLSLVITRFLHSMLIKYYKKHNNYQFKVKPHKFRLIELSLLAARRTLTAQCFDWDWLEKTVNKQETTFLSLQFQFHSAYSTYVSSHAHTT